VIVDAGDLSLPERSGEGFRALATRWLFCGPAFLEAASILFTNNKRVAGKCQRVSFKVR